MAVDENGVRDDNIANNNSRHTIRGTNFANDHGDADDTDEDGYTYKRAVVVLKIR